MSKFQKFSLFFIRISLGWFYLYAGLTKVLDPKWSAAAYIKGSQVLPQVYGWFLQPNILPIVNFVNEWGLVLLGLSLIFGFLVRPAAILGSLMMLMYYLAALRGFMPSTNSLIVDQHIIYIFVLLYLAAIRAGKIYGLDGYFMRRLG